MKRWEQIEHFKNGKPHLISEQVASRKSSETEYFDDGQLEETGTRKGQTTGYQDPMHADFDVVRKQYSEKGVLLATESCKDGQREGLSQSFEFDENKNPVIVDETYKNSKISKRVVTIEKTKKMIRETVYMPDGSVKSDKEF